MKNFLKYFAAPIAAALLSGVIVAWAAQNNYLGTVFIADSTVPSRQLTVNSDGSINVTGSFSANTSSFAPSLSFGTCTATGSQCSSTALPTNTGSVILFNAGTTTVSCTLASGAATATTNELQIPASSGLPLATVYGATTYDHFACIDQTGSASNTVIASGGTGLPTGWGGGGSGGGGGAVYGPTANGSAAANPPILMGGTANGGATGNVANATILAGNSATTTMPAVVVADPNLLAAAVAAVPGYYATAYNTCSQISGTTAPICVDLNGNMYANISRYMGTAGSANAAVMSVQGIPSMKPVFIIGNAGGAFDGATGAAAPANGVQVTAKASGATGGYSAGLIQCDQHTFKHITSATDTLAIQGVASQTIYFCGWRARAAGVATWYFEDEAFAPRNDEVL